MATLDDINILDRQPFDPEMLLRSGRQPTVEPIPIEERTPVKDFFYNNVLNSSGRKMVDFARAEFNNPLNFFPATAVIGKANKARQGIASLRSKMDDGIGGGGGNNPPRTINDIRKFANENQEKKLKPLGLVAKLSSPNDKIYKFDKGHWNYTKDNGIEITLKNPIPIESELAEMSYKQGVPDIILDAIGNAGTKQKGLASKELKKLLDELDQRDMSMGLEVFHKRASLGDALELTDNQLKSWYKRNGFTFEGDSYFGFRPKKSIRTKKNYKSTASKVGDDIDKIAQGVSNRQQQLIKLKKELELEGGDMSPKTVKITEKKIDKLIKEIYDMSK